LWLQSVTVECVAFSYAAIQYKYKMEYPGANSTGVLTDYELTRLLSLLSLEHASRRSSSPPAMYSSPPLRGTPPRRSLPVDPRPHSARGSGSATPRHPARGPLEAWHCGAPCRDHDGGCRWRSERCPILTHLFWRHGASHDVPSPVVTAELTPCRTHPPPC